MKNQGMDIPKDLIATQNRIYPSAQFSCFPQRQTIIKSKGSKKCQKEAAYLNGEICALGGNELVTQFSELVLLDLAAAGHGDVGFDAVFAEPEDVSGGLVPAQPLPRPLSHLLVRQPLLSGGTLEEGADHLAVLAVPEAYDDGALDRGVGY